VLSLKAVTELIFLKHIQKSRQR